MPRILLFGVQSRNFCNCRMPKVLKAAGFEVAVVARQTNYLHVAAGVERHFFFRPRRFAPGILRGVETAFREFAPDIIIPGDERAASLVRYWVAKERAGSNQFSAGLRGTLGQSLGSLETLDQRSFKTETLRLARSLGLRAPREVVANDLDEALAAAESFGYPVIVKAVHGVGGRLTWLCDDREALEHYFVRLHRSLTSKTKLYRRRLLRRDWFPGTPMLTVQAYVRGRPAMACAAALSGSSLAVLTGITEQSVKGNGPSSIVRLSEHGGMVSAAAAMISAFGASGIISFDFVIDGDGQEHLIECNPRPIQIFHLGRLVGVNLAESLKQGLCGDIPAAPKVVDGRSATVALFPHEWYRMPNSPELARVYHDVPWDDPRLLKAIMNTMMRTRLGRFDGEDWQPARSDAGLQDDDE